MKEEKSRGYVCSPPPHPIPNGINLPARGRRVGIGQNFSIIDGYRSPACPKIVTARAYRRDATHAALSAGHGEVGGIFRAGYKNSYILGIYSMRVRLCACASVFVRTFVRVRVCLSLYMCVRVCVCASARAYGVVWNVVLRRTQRPGPRSVRTCICAYIYVYTGGILDRGHRSQDSARKKDEKKKMKKKINTRLPVVRFERNRRKKKKGTFIKDIH